MAPMIAGWVNQKSAFNLLCHKGVTKLISLLRSGPGILVFECADIHLFEQYLIHQFGTYNTTLNEAFENSNEHFTIILLVDQMKDIIKSVDVKDVFLIQQDADAVLCTILNDNQGHLITHARIAPRILIMRAFGDTERILHEIQKDHDAITGSFLNILDNYNEKGTIIALTHKPLNQNISISDLYEKSLFLQEKHSILHKYLRIHALKYLNEGLHNEDWHELEIKIYDIYEAYTLHYERLIKVLENLELGFILGESWGQDFPKMFLSIGIYRIRFFTFFDPKYIKKFLTGLEFLDDGTRVVDYDVFYRRKKINWTEVKEDKKDQKLDISLRYRKEIFSKLNKEQIKEIRALEEQIRKTRK